MDLSTRYRGLTLKYSLVVASSPISTKEESIPKMRDILGGSPQTWQAEVGGQDRQLPPCKILSTS